MSDKKNLQKSDFKDQDVECEKNHRKGQRAFRMRTVEIMG